MNKKEQSENMNLSFWTNWTPFSADPLDYDSFVHHLVFRSTFSSVVSEYSANGYSGVLAKSWKASDDFRTWVLYIRDDAKFENGDVISPDIIIKSWKRMAYLLKKKKSETAFFKDLIGIDSFTNINDELSGMTNDQNSITLKFEKPKEDFLEIVSFGFY